MTSRWMKFYPSDWRSDPALRACSPTARAIWIDLIGLMHEAEPYGYLLLNGAKPEVKTLCGLLNMHHKTLIAGLKELSDHGVYSADENGVIYSRRMVRDHAKALRDQENGRRGGNPGVNPQRQAGVNPPVKGGVKAQKPEARSQIEETPTLRFGVSEPAKPKRKSPALRQAMTIDTPMPDASRTFAAERGFVNGSADALWERFNNHHAGKGTLLANVEAAFRTWVLNEIKFQGERNGNQSGASGAERAGPRAQQRSGPRSATTILFELADQHELEDERERARRAGIA